MKNLPTEATTDTAENPVTGEKKDNGIALFEEPGAGKGTRRAISEIIKWANYVTENRFVIVAADLAESSPVGGMPQQEGFSSWIDRLGVENGDVLGVT